MQVVSWLLRGLNKSGSTALNMSVVPSLHLGCYIFRPSDILNTVYPKVSLSNC